MAENGPGRSIWQGVAVSLVVVLLTGGGAFLSLLGEVGAIEQQVKAQAREIALLIRSLEARIDVVGDDRYRASRAAADQARLEALISRLEDQLNGLKERLDTGQFPPSVYLRPSIRQGKELGSEQRFPAFEIPKR